MAKQKITSQQTSSPYKFKAYRNSAWTAPAGETLVPFDSKSYDPNNNFNTATGQYTVPATGLYSFSGRISVNQVTRSFVDIYVNNVIASRGADTTVSAAPVGTNISTDLQLTAGDLVDLRVYTTNSGSIEPDATRAYFSGRMVSV